MLNQGNDTRRDGVATRDNAALNRFELAVDDGVAFLSYRRDGKVLSLNHAEVPANMEGRGVGSRLVREALEITRAAGERVVPRCSFVVAYLKQHPEFDDLRGG